MDYRERICRICLKSETNQEFTKIFSKNNEIALKLNLVGGISVIEFEDSVGPSLICELCLKELYQCFLFRKKCQSADEFWNQRTAISEQSLWDQESCDASDSKDFKVEPEEHESDLIAFDLVEDCSESHLEQSFVDECPSPYQYEEPVAVEMSTISTVRRNVPKQKSKKSANKTMQCRYCGIYLSRRNRRIEHERLHQLDETKQFYFCWFCGRSFNQKFGLVPHFLKCHDFRLGPKEKWKCAICPNKTLPPGNMGLHYEKYHPNFSSVTKTSVVSLPRAEPRVPRLPKRPRQQKTSPNFWPCSICGNSYSNHHRYLKHLRDIHGLEDSQLIQDTAAIKNLTVKNESGRAQNSEEKPAKFPCTTCGKVFASMMTVRAHEKTHLNIEYQCDLCGSSFRVKAYLTAHVQKVHMKLKKFKCSIENCSASFVHRELLNYHVKKHLNIRNFSCRYCGKTFLTRSCCKIHERIHTDERPYSCHFCDRTFIHHSDHRRHELKHAEKGHNTETSVVPEHFPVVNE